MKRFTVFIAENVFAFKFLYLLFALLSLVPYLYQYVSNWVQTVIILYAILIFFADLLITRNIFHNKYCIYLFAFAGTVLISTLINMERGFQDNLYILLFLCIQLFVLARPDLKRPPEKAKRELKYLIHTTIIVISIVSLVSIIFYIMKWNGIYYVNETKPWKEFLYYGLSHGNRLTGITANPNILAMASAAALALTVVCFTLVKPGRAGKTLYILALLINTISLVLTASRGAQAAFGVFLIVFGIVTFKQKIKEDKHKWVKQIALFLCCTAVVFVLFLCINPIHRGMGYVQAFASALQYQEPGQSAVQEPSQSEGYVSKEDKNLTEIIQDEYTDPVRNTEEETFSNGREQVWCAGLDIIKAHPLFGVGKASVVYYARLYEPDKSLPGIEGGSLHNILMEIFADYGIFAFAVFIIFGAILVRDGFKSLRRKNAYQYYREIGGIFSVFTYFVAENLVESRLLFDTGVINGLFMILLGYFMYYLQIGREYEPNWLEKHITLRRK